MQLPPISNSIVKGYRIVWKSRADPTIYGSGEPFEDYQLFKVAAEQANAKNPEFIHEVLALPWDWEGPAPHPKYIPPCV